METKLRLFIYGNEACMNRRETMPGDCEDYYETDITVTDGKDLFKQLYKELYDYDEEDLEYMEEPSDDIEEVIRDYDAAQDYGDGAQVLYAVYDLTNKKWLMGDEDSKREWLTEYIDPEEYEDEGYDFEDIAHMNID